MQQRFVKNLAFLLFLNLLIKPFWILGVDRSVQNQVGDVSYGFFLSMYSFSLVFFILLDIGITNYNNRNIAQNNQLLAKHFAGIATMKLILGLLYSITIFLIGLLIGYNAEQLNMLAWLVLNQFLLSFLLYLRSNISGLLLFKTDSFLSVLDRLLMIVICSILLWSGWVASPIKISWFVYAQVVSYVITTFVALFIVLKHTGKVKLTFNLAFSLMIFKKSMPFALLVLLMSLYNRLEPVLLERLLPEGIGYHQTGIYGRAFRLLDAGNNISLLFAVLLLPIFSTLIKRGESVNNLVKLSFTIIITMSITVAIISIAFSEQILGLLYPQQLNETLTVFTQRISDSSSVFCMLMGSFVAISSTYIFGTLLTANGNLRQLNISALAGVILNVSFNFILIPYYEAFGASIASFSVQTLTAIIQFILAVKIMKLRFGNSFWLRLASFFSVVVIGAYSARNIQIDWILQLALAFSLSIVSVFALKLIRINDVTTMIKEIVKNMRKQTSQEVNNLST
jgi:O-antigen/teichoic acid export membrane protein